MPPRWPALAALGAAAAGARAPRAALDRVLGLNYGAPPRAEGGDCPSPPLAAVTVRTVLGHRGELVLVRYTYYEPGQGETEWTTVFHQPAACSGSGERQFTVERTKIGLEVVNMTGPRRVAEPQ
jgi:hypothetical protein